MRKPNLFLIGAMKAGTSSLHEYLNQHPEIFMSAHKEPQWFAPHQLRTGEFFGIGHNLPVGGESWYLTLFNQANEEKYIGESSVSYSARHWVPDCEHRIYEFSPNARIVYLLRDPVDRAISHYWHYVKDGREDLKPFDAFRRRDSYVKRSDYAMQIIPYIKRFGGDNVYMDTFENMIRNPTIFFRNLFCWLGIDEKFAVNIETAHNVGPKLLRGTRRGLTCFDTASKHWRGKQILARLPKPASKIFDIAIRKTIDRASVDIRKSKDFLRKQLMPTTHQLRELTGKEYNEWHSIYDTGTQDRKALITQKSDIEKNMNKKFRYHKRAQYLSEYNTLIK